MFQEVKENKLGLNNPLGCVCTTLYYLFYLCQGRYWLKGVCLNKTRLIPFDIFDLKKNPAV